MIKLNGEALYQWETGRTVSGFTGNVAQFANAGDSIAMSITVENGGSVRIPDRYLATGKNLVVYDVQTGNDDEETVISVKVFPVKGKAKPKDYVPTTAEAAYGVVKDLSDKAKSAAKAAEAAKNKAQTYALEAEDSAKNAYHYATNAKESADKAAETVQRLAPLIVDLNAADYDLPDILAALAAGRDVQLHVEDFENVPDGMYRLLGVASDSALFATEEDGMLIVIHFHEGPQIDAYNYPLDLLDDEKEDTSHTWSSAKILEKILEMIAQGGTGNISMSDRTIGCGALRTWELGVESEEDGFSIKAEQENGDWNKPVAQFHGWHAEDSVILRNIADGTQNHDAVNKGQMDAALADKAKIDDSKIGADAWSSKNIIDRLCPPINETGLLVQCSPLEGYPLEVQAKERGDISGVTVTVCGKNLYDAQKYPFTDGYYINKGNGDANGSGTHASYCATLGYIPVSHLQGMTITLNNIPGGSAPGMAFYDANKVRTDPALNGKGNNQIVPENAVYMRFCTYKTQKTEAQIEIGSTATDYEPYSGDNITTDGDAASEFIPVTSIVDRSGLTTVFAYVGLEENLGELTTATEVKVFGKADPSAEVRRLNDNVAELKAAILTMGANV